MSVALYPGSFDPIHKGHIAIIEAGASLFAQVIVAVGYNQAKPSGMFTAAERMEMIEQSVAHLPNVRVDTFSGLVTAAAAQLGASCLLKGIRSGTDLDAEMLQANMNAKTGNGIPSVFLPGLGDEALISSRYVREIASAGGDVSAVVPKVVLSALQERQTGKAGEVHPDRA